MIPLRYHRGVELTAHGLWLDPHDRKPLAFISHAHADHLGTHDEVIVSRGTAALMHARIGARKTEHVLEFGQRLELRGLGITLLPAGHVFGSAQSFLESPAGTLLYTGDFKLRPGLSAERTEWRTADTLIMETTYGLPRYTMPPTEETLGRMLDFCRDALADGATPVLLGYSLGKAQEILCALLEAGLTPMLHGAVWKLTEIYRSLRPGFPTGYVRYAADETAGKVLVCPPSANRTKMITRIKDRRVAALTGWALDPGAVFRYQCDAAFPLTDHADYPDLVRYVELVQPKRVLTLHGFAAEFARDLRERGIEAWALSEVEQLELRLGRRPTVQPNGGTMSAQPAATAGEASALPANSFAKFAATGEALAATSSRLRKTALLAEYLRGLDPAALPLAVVYFCGRAFPQGDPRVLQAGWTITRRAVQTASGVSEEAFRRASRAHADAGRTTYEVMLGRTAPPDWTLAQSHEFFTALAAARGPLRKTALIEECLRRLGAREASYVVKILTGDLRIGLKDGLVEEAIAEAFGADSAAVREAGMLIGDLGEVAVLAAQARLAEAEVRLFRPVRAMLASPEASAQAILERLGKAGPLHAWAEDKYDGIRAQLHIGHGRVEIFTRDLRVVTGQFAELAGAARRLAQAVILDGEILAYSEGGALTFFDLQKRLGRPTEDDLFLGASNVPVIFRAFDLLYLEGTALLRAPLAERRAKLETLPLPHPLEHAPRHTFTSAAELDTLFAAARARGNEGLVVKDGASLYTPGRRGTAWLKYKRELATLDVVVVGVEQGHGRRAHVLSDYTFAVRDEASGALLPIGKAYSGLTDDEIEELTEHFTASTTAQHGRYREVRPEIVLEVAFDHIQPSQRHASGLALRFPRIKAIRRDKTPTEINTLAEARRLADGPA
jgi:DNA ligase-1